jgi:hypothetical protein
MKVCPSCGTEAKDDYLFCSECGEELEEKLETPRESLIENIRHAIRTTQNAPRLFLPVIIVYISAIVLLFVPIIAIGSMDINLQNIPSILSRIISTAPILLIFIVDFLTIVYLGLIIMPFTQNVYYKATIGEVFSLHDSFKYARSMTLQYLVAYIAEISVLAPVMWLWLRTVPPDAWLMYENNPVQLILSHGWTLIFLVPVFGIFFTVLCIMAWDNISLVPALKSTYLFIKRNTLKLGLLLIIYTVLTEVVTFIPFGAILSFIIGTNLNIALIDAYLYHQVVLNSENL